MSEYTLCKCDNDIMVLYDDDGHDELVTTQDLDYTIISDEHRRIIKNKAVLLSQSNLNTLTLHI